MKYLANNKKGMEQSLWLVVAAVIFLVILAVIIFMVMKGIGPVNATCTSKGGECKTGSPITACDYSTELASGFCTEKEDPKCTKGTACICCIKTQK